MQLIYAIRARIAYMWATQKKLRIFNILNLFCVVHFGWVWTYHELTNYAKDCFCDFIICRVIYINCDYDLFLSPAINRTSTVFSMHKLPRRCTCVSGTAPTQAACLLVCSMCQPWPESQQDIAKSAITRGMLQRLAYLTSEVEQTTTHHNPDTNFPNFSPEGNILAFKPNRAGNHSNGICPIPTIWTTTTIMFALWCLRMRPINRWLLRECDFLPNELLLF